MKKLILLFLLCLQLYCFGQGENNNYDIDSEDLKSVFEGQGIHIFKYPFDLKKGEYISISYEIFENGKLTSKKNIIEDIQIENRITFDHHIARKDTTVFHRFYFFEKNDTLTMKQTLPGIKPVEKVDLSKIVTGSFNSRTNIPTELPKKEEILFYYGNKSDGWLNCSSGILKTDLIKRYDFVILFYAEKIKSERIKTILEEIKSSAKNTMSYEKH
ncbi:hypothetical protein DHD32_22645 [Arenibacter sp. TNZ]|uniref:hypothetical protein n=1 Tax=Arenibacter TaxID=178469 RepID=UPI000CD47028|nr:MULTISPECIES: hypothetical protein [Arenibacter]MCM4174269.1 hypothetical protein [Arenibacter sp. TNZ]